mgnify:CR=1 FL=1
MKKKIFNLVLTSGLLFSLAACQKDASENVMLESESQHQIVETVQTAEVKTESLSQSEEVEAESSTPSEEAETEAVNQAEVIQNEFFSVFFDSLKEEDEFYVFTFIFTNVSDIAYYKGDEQYQPGEFWEKKIKIPKEKIGDYCKNANYIHYKLYDLSVYDENAKELFAGGAGFKLNADLEIDNLA